MTKTKKSAESVIKDIKRKTRRKFSSEEKIRIVIEGLKGEESIAGICRREGIVPALYYRWSKDFMEAGKKRLLGDTVREANTDEVKYLREENRDLKEVVAELTLRERVLKKSLRGLA
jgi:transposase|tara:strand:+ start:112 stop:462 length:351 start_codon:yes stop_codon:yes gene_type:complete